MDFLGFSRSNRDFSIGYADFCEKNFSWAFSLALRGADTEEPAVEAMRKRRKVHGAKLNLISDFLQSIVVRAVAFLALAPRLECDANPIAGSKKAYGLSVRATRKPRWLYRTVVQYLPRSAELRRAGIKSQEAPRTTWPLQSLFLHAEPSAGAPW